VGEVVVVDGAVVVGTVIVGNGAAGTVVAVVDLLAS